MEDQVRNLQSHQKQQQPVSNSPPSPSATVQEAVQDFIKDSGRELFQAQCKLLSNQLEQKVTLLESAAYDAASREEIQAGLNSNACLIVQLVFNSCFIDANINLSIWIIWKVQELENHLRKTFFSISEVETFSSFEMKDYIMEKLGNALVIVDLNISTLIAAEEYFEQFLHQAVWVGFIRFQMMFT